MAKSDHRRAKTLSISLTPELSGAVQERVESGMYTSASELIREALRLLLRSEDAPVPVAASRFRSAEELIQTGLELGAQKIRAAEPHLSDDEVRVRLQQLSNQQEAGPGLRISPSRLERLKST